MSKSKKTHYVVLVGLTPGIYNDYQQAFAQVNGISGGKLQGFYSLSEATAFFKENPKVTTSTPEEERGEWKRIGKATATEKQVNYIFGLKRDVGEMRFAHVLERYDIYDEGDVEELDIGTASLIIDELLEAKGGVIKFDNIKEKDERLSKDQGPGSIGDLESALDKLKRKMGKNK